MKQEAKDRKRYDGTVSRGKVWRTTAQAGTYLTLHTKNFTRAPDLPSIEALGSEIEIYL
jgi:hypothetical protein